MDPMVSTCGEKPSSLETLAIREFLWEMFVSLSQDCQLHYRCVQTLRRRLDHEGFSFLTKTLPLLGKSLEDGLRSGKYVCPSNFHRWKNSSALPALLGLQFRNVFTIDGRLLDDVSVFDVWVIRQVCNFAYKAKLPRKEEDDQRVVDNFVSTEAHLRQMRFETKEYLVIKTLASNLISQVFDDFQAFRINPKHGPGVTSNVGQNQKDSARLSPNLGVYRVWGSQFFANLDDSYSRLERYPCNNHHTLFTESVSAKVILVPKDSRGPRLISCEPVEHQFIQQGIARYMVDSLEANYLSSGHVNFTDQTVNRRLALEGSVDGSFATLDLKDASDRVHLQVVDDFFSGCPELLASLHLSRSRKTQLPDGTLLELQKFAPMGSACCFPVLSTVAWSTAIAGIMLNGISLDDALSSVYVYGDDIICRTEHSTFVVHALECVGLAVNINKSFSSGSFRESCGCDAFRGNDVTPVRLRVGPLQDTDINGDGVPAHLVSFTMTANLLFKSGFFRASEKLYSQVERLLGPLPYGDDFSPYLHRETPLELRGRTIEANYLDRIRVENGRLVGRLKWTRSGFKDRNLYPLGTSLLAWRIKPRKKRAPEPWGAFLSRWGRARGPQDVLSYLDDPIEVSQGVFSSARDIILVNSFENHYTQDTLMWS